MFCDLGMLYSLKDLGSDVRTDEGFFRWWSDVVHCEIRLVYEQICRQSYVLYKGADPGVVRKFGVEEFIEVILFHDQTSTQIYHTIKSDRTEDTDVAELAMSAAEVATLRNFFKSRIVTL